MSTDASIGHGSAFKRSSDGTSGGTMTAVAEVMAINGPGLSRDAIDVTDMDSANRYREFIGGLRDAGEVSLDVNFDPDGTDVTNWLADYAANTAGYYQIVFPDNTTWGFSALLTGFEPGDPFDDKMTATVTYKITGAPTFS